MARTRKSLAAAAAAARRAAGPTTAPAPENPLTAIFNMDDESSHATHSELLSSLEGPPVASTSAAHLEEAYPDHGQAQGEGELELTHPHDEAHHALAHFADNIDPAFHEQAHPPEATALDEGDLQAAQEAFWAALPLGDDAHHDVAAEHAAALDELSRAMTQAHDPDNPQYVDEHQHHDRHQLDPNHHADSQHHYPYDHHDPNHHDPDQHHHQQPEQHPPHHEPHPMDHQPYPDQNMMGHDQFGGGGYGPEVILGPDGEPLNKKETHKEVERRRRETINTGINRLAAIVPTNEKNKAAILEKAAQYIELLRQNETQNIERWTMERLMMDQSLEDMKRVVEEEAELRRRAEERCQRLINAQAHHQAQLEAVRNGQPLPLADISIPTPAPAPAPAPRRAAPTPAPAPPTNPPPPVRTVPALITTLSATSTGPRSRGPMGLPTPTSTSTYATQSPLPTSAPAMPTPPRSSRTDDLFGDDDDEEEGEEEMDEIDLEEMEMKRKAVAAAATATAAKAPKKKQRVR